MYDGGDPDILNAKSRILNIFTELDEDEILSIEQWINSQAYKQDLQKKLSLQNTEKTLIKIGNAIKETIPFEAEMPSEKIVPPTVGDQADCNAINTCHIDEYLYDEDEVEKLVKEGKIKRHYCLDCNSRNIEDLIFISHSMSRQALQYIYKVLLPRDLDDKQILDVGSRIGAVIYAGYYLSNATNIYGIEMNKECCEVQDKIINQFSLDINRIKVVCADVLDRSDIVHNSDIIIISVLDFFVDNEKHKQMWYFFKKYIKKGSYIVVNRSIAETLDNLEIAEDLLNWFSVCSPQQPENEIYFNLEDCSELLLYTVN